MPSAVFPRNDLPSRGVRSISSLTGEVRVRTVTSKQGEDDTSPPPEFVVLGSLEVRSGSTLIPVTGDLQRRVLVALLLEAGRVVPVSRLVMAAWDEEPPDSAEHQVRKTVAKLRSRIPHGPDIIV